MAIAFRATRGGTDQTGVSSNVYTKVNFNNVSGGSNGFNVGDGFDTTNSRFVAPVAGIYEIAAAVPFAGLPSGTVSSVAIYKNGAAHSLDFVSMATAMNGGSTISDLVELDEGDTVEIYALQNSGASKDVKGQIVETWVSGFLVAVSTEQRIGN